MNIRRFRKLSIILPVILPSFLWGGLYVDQEGYRPSDRKYLFVVSAADSFEIRDSVTHTTIFKDALTSYAVIDPATGFSLSRGEFSDLINPGRYYAAVSGADSSCIFTIADTVYNQLFRKSLKGFYFQRCGFDLLGPTVGNYYHSKCHNADGMYHSSTGLVGFHLAGGGWHDAGDYGKYIVNAGVTVGTLLMAYEYFPEKFSSDDIHIAESGNGIPDILDEVRYELEWMQTMQGTDGGVYHKLTPQQFSGFIMPQNDYSTRYIYEVSSAATGDFAAVMARASRIYQAFDPGFADSCLTAAESAWQYLDLHPSVQPPGGFQNPAGTATGVYGDSDDRDERLWAAVELYLATGELTYHNYYIARYQSTLISSAMSWQNVGTMAHLSYLCGSQSGMSGLIKTTLSQSLNSFCQNMIIRHASNGFHVTLNPGEYTWGSNASVLNNAVMLIFGYEQLQNEMFRDAAVDQLHYILGNNAHKMSFVTGTGSVSPLHPHHRPSAADGVAEPVPGLLAGGPNQYLNDPVLQSHFTSSTPPALCYLDDEASYASNEIAINWNAPLVFVAGYFAEFVSTGISVPEKGSLIPRGIYLNQNYPNPFNPKTVIRWQLAVGSPVNVTVYSITGEKVAILVNERQPAGKHTVTFDASRLASGIYWYVLTAGGHRLHRKMILVK
ncbi:MAG: T9SS C-terminal target domain-containing protein [Calditrichaeota bacterium]|nr:MAG: T9SS C-terminal target domain-containing protein [Calditrichota bacterium]